MASMQRALALLWAALCVNEAFGLSMEVTMEATMKAAMRKLVRTEEEIRANMTMDTAYDLVMHKAKGKAKSELVSLIQSSVGKKLHHVGAAKAGLRKGALAVHRAGANVTRSEPTGYAALDKARDMLNSMMQEAGMDMDLSVQKCNNFERTQLGLMNQAMQDVSSFNSLAAEARGHVLKAQSAIGYITETVPVLESELSQHRRECSIHIASAQYDLSIIKADLNVMERILNMTKCDSPSLLQRSKGSRGATHGLLRCAHCVGGVGGSGLIMLQGGDGDIQPMLQGLKSEIAKKYVQENLASLYSDSEGHAIALTQEQVRHHTAQLKKRLHRGRAALLRAEPTDEEEEEEPTMEAFGVSDEAGLNISEVPTAPEPADCVPTTKCTLGTANCRRLREKFLNVQGGMQDHQKVLEIDLANLERYCEQTDLSLSNQLSTLAEELREEQTNLAVATKDQIDAESSSHQKGQQHKELKEEYTETMTECCTEQNDLRSEVCALTKIRGELYKMEGETVFMTDCETSDWTPGQCTATCGGGTRLKTREIIVHPIKGAACGPLEMTENCNSQNCPVDCVVGDWGGWSDCSSGCGGGVRERVRDIEVPMRYGGNPCESTEEEEPCNMQSCNAECVLSHWGAWSQCNKACDTGHRSRTRAIAEPARGSGSCSEPTSEERLQFEVCNDFSCSRLLPRGRSTLRCVSKIDLVLVVDGSGSLGQYGWDQSVVATKKLVEAFNAVGDSVKVATLLFSGSATEWITHLNQDTTQSDVENMVWPEGGTWTHVALDLARGEFLYGRDDAQSVVIVLTDGHPTRPVETKTAAQHLQQKARVIWVPVGAGAPIKLINEMASLPTRDHVVQIPDFYYMDWPYFLNDLIADACPNVV